MRIEVKNNYGGSLTKERRILPGEYDSEDPALFGLADYLLEHGHAITAIEIASIQTVIPSISITTSDVVPTTVGVPRGVITLAELEQEQETPEVVEDDNQPEEEPKRGRRKKE